MDHERIWYLKKFNLLQSLNQQEMESLSDKVIDSLVKKKQPVFLTGDPNESLYFLKKGRVKVSRVDESGKEFTLILLDQVKYLVSWVYLMIRHGKPLPLLWKIV